MARRFREGRGRHAGGPGRTLPRPASHSGHEARPRPTLDTRGAGTVHPERREVAVPPPVVSAEAEATAGGVDAPLEILVEPTPPTAAGIRAAARDVPDPDGRSGPTTAQLRRFIKSRPYVPMHELRRRFGLNGHDDDVVRVEVGDQAVWVGLPADAGRMLGDLLRQGDVGCELSVDPASPVVIGVFPMRPVARS